MGTPNMFSAGIPKQVGSSAYQVGDQITMAEIGSYFYRNNDQNDMWLKHGVLLAAAGFPKAKTIEYLKAHGLAGSQPNLINCLNGFGEYATDGNGKWVFAYGHDTNVLVSVDNQRNWALVAHNCASAVTSVTYSVALSLFIGGGNTATTFNFCSQTPASVASAWTARAGTAVSAGTADTTLVRAGPNEVVAVCIANAGGVGQASYSTNGTAWTAKNFAGGLSSGNLSTCGLSNAGSSNWFYSQPSGLCQKTVDGQTWTNQSHPSAPQYSAFAFGQVFTVDGANQIHSSPLGATGTWASLGVPLAANKIRRLYFDGVRLLATLYVNGPTYQPAFAWTLDGGAWFVRGFAKSWNSTFDTAIGAIGDTIGFMPLGLSAVGCSYSSFSNPDFIGVPWLNLSTGQATYSKVR